MWHRVKDAVKGAQQSLVRTGLKSRQETGGAESSSGSHQMGA